MRVAKSNQIARASRAASRAVLGELNRLPIVSEFSGEESVLLDLPTLSFVRAQCCRVPNNWPTKQPG